MCPAVDGPVVSSGFFQGEESAGHTVSCRSRWKACPDCQRLILESGIKSGGGITAEQYLQAMFMRRVEEYLISRGRRAVAWDEILEGGTAREGCRDGT